MFLISRTFFFPRGDPFLLFASLLLPYLWHGVGASHYHTSLSTKGGRLLITVHAIRITDADGLVVCVTPPHRGGESVNAWIIRSTLEQSRSLSGCRGKTGFYDVNAIPPVATHPRTGDKNMTNDDGTEVYGSCVHFPCNRTHRTRTRRATFMGDCRCAKWGTLGFGRAMYLVPVAIFGTLTHTHTHVNRQEGKWFLMSTLGNDGHILTCFRKLSQCARATTTQWGFFFCCYYQFSLPVPSISCTFSLLGARRRGPLRVFRVTFLRCWYFSPRFGGHLFVFNFGVLGRLVRTARPGTEFN